MRMRPVHLLSCLSVLALFCAHADVTLPAVISDNMVLQQDKDCPIWGKAEPGEKVTVSIAGKKASTKAGADGQWSVKIGGIKAGGPYEMTIAGKNEIKISNILAGEVWVASGQSNMEWTVKNSRDPEQEIANAKFPSIRMFTVKKKVAGEPQSNCEGKWEVCDSSTVANFSAVGYFFARELYQRLGIPVGVIHTSWGGTPAESWTSAEGLQNDPDFQPIIENFKKKVENFPKARDAYPEQVKKWEEAAAKAKAENKPVPNKPRQPSEPENDPWKPSGLYNGMIAPILNYRIAGAIWYQGESNAGRAYQYRKLFPNMITDWRKHFKQGNDFPFLWVQLANFMAKKPEPGESSWAELREAQQMTLKLPNTGTGLAIDIGEEKDIHPKNKQDVGRRLAFGALKIAYNRENAFSGPVYDSVDFKDGKAEVKFKHAFEGLKVKGDKLTGFAIAGEDKKFVWADAKIIGNDKVQVWSDAVKAPVAVRYGWADNPDVALYNNADLPASPFRTDEWDGVTKGKN
ncbi:MAG TPA: sialate O-acetylesterase [Planctomycetota bacterium]|nr:sialate O-acetylesterase [Planctomycetota bacterium]